MTRRYYTQVINILIIIFVLNFIVALSKVMYGYSHNISSMTADGFHSISDAASNIIGIFAILWASKPADDCHPYGHDKFETLASLIISILLFFMSFEIISQCINRVFNPTSIYIDKYSFVVMIVSTIINYFVYKYEYSRGSSLKSDILISDSIHTKSDIAVSISVFIGLFAIKAGFVFIDILVSIIISIMILKSGFDILIYSLKVFLDGAMINKNDLYEFVIGIPNVIFCHKIRSRGKNNSIIIDLHIGVNPNMSIKDAHELSHSIEHMIIDKFEGVSEVIIHIEPDKKST